MGLLVAVSGNSIYSVVQGLFNSIINFLASLGEAIDKYIDIIAPVLGVTAFILLISPYICDLPIIKRFCK